MRITVTGKVSAEALDMLSDIKWKEKITLSQSIFLALQFAKAHEWEFRDFCSNYTE